MAGSGMAGSGMNGSVRDGSVFDGAGSPGGVRELSWGSVGVGRTAAVGSDSTATGAAELSGAAGAFASGGGSA
jgi:hypothetical protein